MTWASLALGASLCPAGQPILAVVAYLLLGLLLAVEHIESFLHSPPGVELSHLHSQLGEYPAAFVIAEFLALSPLLPIVRVIAAVAVVVAFIRKGTA